MIKDITKKDKSELTFREKAIINLYDMASVLTVALVTIMLIFTFVFRIVGVVGSSMVPTLHDGDWLMVSAYDREPQYGQVVIVTQPNWFDEPIVKRIIATENQVVDIDFYKGDVYVDGVLLDEPYISTPTTNKGSVEMPVYVPEGCVFVMGDNRLGSLDSRDKRIGDNGIIDNRYILGHAIFRFMPFDKMGRLDNK